MTANSSRATRIARPEDIPALNRLVNSAYRGEGSKKGWTTEADLIGGQRTDEAMLADLLGKPENTLLLLEQGPELVGCVLLRDLGDRGYFGLLTVRPDLQSAGLGRELLTAAEEWVKYRWNHLKLEMRVLRPRPELIGWYERRGYKNTGRIEPYPYDDEHSGLPKVAGLEFIVFEKEL